MNRFGAEFRAEVDGDTLTGTAVVFSSHAEVKGHLEAVTRAAFEEALGRDDDVKALVNHNPAMVLGSTRSKTLRLATDEHGLRFELDLPDTTYAHDLKELVGRNDVTGMSFGFIPHADAWGRAPDGRQLRTYTSFKRLLDVSPVAYPAYDGTELYLRSMTFDRPRTTARSQLIRLRAAQILREAR